MRNAWVKVQERVTELAPEFGQVDACSEPAQLFCRASEGGVCEGRSDSGKHWGDSYLYQIQCIIIVLLYFTFTSMLCVSIVNFIMLP